MIKKTDIFKPGNTFAYQKIELVCSYYNLFVGIFLVLPLALVRISFDSGINLILCIPFFIMFYLASYSNIKELGVIVGYYLTAFLLLRYDICLLPKEVYIFVMIVGIIFNSLSVYLESKCKDNNSIIVDNDKPQQNRNGKKFRDL
mgnify:FL=1